MLQYREIEGIVCIRVLCAYVYYMHTCIICIRVLYACVYYMHTCIICIRVLYAYVYSAEVEFDLYMLVKFNFICIIHAPNSLTLLYSRLVTKCCITHVFLILVFNG